MYKKLFVIGGAVLCLSATSAMARDSFGVGVVAGTLGAGVTVTTPINDVLNVRVLATGASFSAEFEGDSDSGAADLTFEGDLTLLNIGALLDYHPFANGLRVSVGLIASRNRIEGRGTCESASGCELGNRQGVVSQGDSVYAEIDYSGVAPYVGIGWGNAVDEAGRWSLSLDLGVMYTGEPEINVVCNVSGSAAGQCQKAAAQEEAELEDELGGYEWFPVLMVGAAYRF